MPRHRHIFTPTAVEVVRGLARQGRSASEIANAVGSTPASVRVKCSQLKIKLRRGRRGVLKQRLVIYMRPADYAALERKARQLQTSSVELAGMLLEAIISSNIYEAVLDDRENWRSSAGSYG